MTYPFWLKKMLVEAGLGNWLHDVQKQIPFASQILPLCTDRFLQGPLEKLDQLSKVTPEYGPEYLDLSRDHLLGLRWPTRTLVRGATPCEPLTHGEEVVRENISTFLHSEFGCDMDPENEVLVTAGPQQALQIILDTYVNTNEGVMLTDPCPKYHQHLATFHGSNTHWLSLRQEEGRLRFSDLEMKRLMRKCKLAVFSLPSNPMGGFFNEDDLATIAFLASRNRCLVFWDTSLMTLQLDNYCTHPGALPNLMEQSLIGGCMGPAHGPLSSQAGWLCAPNRLLSPCKTLMEMQLRVTGAHEQTALLESLKSFRSQEQQLLLQRLRQNRSHAYSRLCSMGLEPYWPLGGSHFWIPVWQKMLSGTGFCDLLASNSQVLVKPGDMFGPCGQAYVRVSFGVDEGKLDEAMRRMALVLENAPVTPPLNRLAA